MNRPISASYDPVESVQLSHCEHAPPVSCGRKRMPFGAFALASVVCGAVVAVSFTWDAAVQQWVQTRVSAGSLQIAGFIGRWGDFGGVAAFAVVVWAVARWCGWSRVQYWIHVMLLSAVLSGLSANVVRVACGRTRPNSGLVEGWHGPAVALDFSKASHRFHAFPSAHTAVVAGFFSPVWVAVSRRRRPQRWYGALASGAVVGILLMAGARVWSGAHHVSDVLAAVLLGSLWGISLAQLRPLARWRKRSAAECRVFWRKLSTR